MVMVAIWASFFLAGRFPGPRFLSSGASANLDPAELQDLPDFLESLLGARAQPRVETRCWCSSFSFFFFSVVFVWGTARRKKIGHRPNLIPS